MSAVLAKSSKHLMLPNLSVPVMQVILPFVIPLVSLFLILLVIVSQLSLLINLLMWTRNISMNDLLIIRAVANMILQSHLVPWMFWYVHIFFIFHHNFCNNNFFKSYVRCNNFSTSELLTTNSVAIFNIKQKNILFSSIVFHHFNFSLYENSYSVSSVFIIFLM